MPKNIYDTKRWLGSLSLLLSGMSILIYYVVSIYPENDFSVLGVGIVLVIFGMIVTFYIRSPIVINEATD